MTTTTQAPDICDIVVYRNDRYRVTGWYKEVSPKPLMTPQERQEALASRDPERIASAILDDILEEEEAEAPRKPRLFPCTREDATHVAIYGVCGFVLPLADVTPTGQRVSWDEETIQEHRDSQARRVKQGYPL